MFRPLLDGILRKAARHYRSKPFTLRHGAPLVSFTFDDVPDTACTNGAVVLERAGICGTFYIAAGICGHRDTDWRVIDRGQVRALYDGGHEIGCHTFSHVRVETLDTRTMADECQRNRPMLKHDDPPCALFDTEFTLGPTCVKPVARRRQRWTSK